MLSGIIQDARGIHNYILLLSSAMPVLQLNYAREAIYDFLWNYNFTVQMVLSKLLSTLS